MGSVSENGDTDTTSAQRITTNKQANARIPNALTQNKAQRAHLLLADLAVAVGVESGRDGRHQRVALLDHLVQRALSNAADNNGRKTVGC